jgi:hypothetical protein
MKKFQYIIFLIVFLVSVSNAQSLQTGIGVSLNTPAGNFSDVVGTGYGGTFMVKIGVPILDITGSIEYIRFSEKEVGNFKFSSAMWSVNAGARISVFPFLSAGAEIGNYWITLTADNGIVKGDNTENKFAFTPLIAAQFSMFEASLRYAIISDASFISIRAGIYF